MIQDMTFTATGTFEMTPEAEAFLAACAADSEKELDRALEQSRLSGMEVVYELGMFGLEWSPVFRHPSREPIAWIAKDGRRHEGPTSPEPKP